MATITKNKNFVVFTNDNGLVYNFNINDGTLTSVKNNHVMHSMPRGGIVQLIRDVTWDKNKYDPFIYAFCFFVSSESLYNLRHDTLTKIQVADKLHSIGYSNIIVFDYDDCVLLNNPNIFKKFAKRFREEPEIDIRDYIEDIAYDDFIEKSGLKEDEHYTRSILKRAFDCYRGSDRPVSPSAFNTSNVLKDSVKNCAILAYYLAKYYDSFVDINERNIDYLVNNYLWLCAQTGIEPEKGDLMRLYPQVKGTYMLAKNKIENESIVKQLARFPLFFEDSQYIVKIPQTVEDFRQEADSQHNCVFRLYMGKVIDGTTNVVFIRKKSNPDESFITCEVNNKGKIVQYLEKYNDSPEPDSSAFRFKGEYQKHLEEAFAVMNVQ